MQLRFSHEIPSWCLAFYSLTSSGLCLPGLLARNQRLEPISLELAPEEEAFLWPLFETHLQSPERKDNCISHPVS